MERWTDRWADGEGGRGSRGMKTVSKDSHETVRGTEEADPPSGRRLSFYDNRGRESLWPEGLVN